MKFNASFQVVQQISSRFTTCTALVPVLSLQRKLKSNLSSTLIRTILVYSISVSHSPLPLIIKSFRKYVIREIESSGVMALSSGGLTFLLKL